MAQLNTINLLAIRDLIRRAEEANKEPDQAIRITRLSQAFQIGAEQPLFKLVIQQQLMADDVLLRLALIAEQGQRMSTVASDIQAAVDRFEAQRVALFANDRIRTLLKLYWHWLSLGAWFFLTLGFVGAIAILG
jgi:hypothetical protein